MHGACRNRISELFPALKRMNISFRDFDVNEVSSSAFNENFMARYLIESEARHLSPVIKNEGGAHRKSRLTDRDSILRERRNMKQDKNDCHARENSCPFVRATD